MPAPDFPSLYDFEGQIEGAFQVVLQTALGTAVTGVFVTRDQTIKDAPRVELEFMKGAALKQRYTMGTPPRQVPNAFVGSLQAKIVTARPLHHDTHGNIRGIVRYTLSAGANVINSGNLPYLQIMEMTPGSDSGMMIDEKAQDVSILKYDLWFAINNSAWPSS